MKKVLFLLVAFLTISSQLAYGWGREGHDAIAYIAECHLKKSARKTIEKYLGNRSIVYYASWMDDYRHTPEYKHSTVWHMAAVDADNNYTDAVKSPKGDVISAIEESIETLKNYKQLDDSTVCVHLKFLIHMVGDMHCPAHVAYSNLEIWYNVNLDGKNVSYHSVWDTRLITSCHRWHYTEWQHQLDRCSKKEFSQMVTGTPRDWFHENAVESRYIYDVAPSGSKLGRDFLNTNIKHAEKQILRAGYRLAHVLNELFG